ncbi:MAG: signal peptidase I [Rhodothermales bacterium]|jgi:signal peptidase I
MSRAFTPELWQGLISASPTRLRITGDSMEPTLRTGETIELAPPPALPLPGDILVYQRNDQLVVHRYLGFGHFQGDNSATPDARVPAEAIVGMATAVFRGNKSHKIPRRFSPRACIRLFSLQVRRVVAGLRNCRKG